MLEDSIGSSPHKANTSIHCTRMRRRNRSQRKRLETEESFDSTSAATTILTASATVTRESSEQRNQEEQQPPTLADMYWDQDAERGSSPPNRTFAVPVHFNPFEDQMLLAAADRITSAQQRDSHKNHLPTTTGFQKCEFLEELVNEETQIEISDTEMLQIWDQVEEAEKKAETLTVKTPPQSKSIVDLILEDFGCSPLSPPVEFKRSMRTYSRRRRKEGAGAADESLETTRQSFAQQLEEVAAPSSSLPFVEDDCLSICSTSSSLSMQEDRTQLPPPPLPALVDGNLLNCSSQKLCQNLLDLSAYFTQQNPSDAEELLTPTTSVSETFGTAIAQHEDPIETCSQSMSQQLAISEPLAEILTLRQKYPISFSRRSSHSSDDFCGFPAVAAGGDDNIDETFLLAINASQSINSNALLCSSQDSGRKISPIRLTAVEHQCDVNLNENRSVHKDELLFSDDDEWLDDDCEFFANFKTQDALHIAKAHTANVPQTSSPKLNAAPTTVTIKKHVSAAAQLLRDLPMKKEKNTTNFQGFQTASRKTIQISEDAQKRAEAIVVDIPDLENLDDNDVDDDQPSTSKAAALKNTAHRPDIRIETKLQLNEKSFNASKFQGFQTASRKTIQISDEAQKRAEALVAAIPDLEDLDLEDDDDNQPSTSKAAALKSTVRPSIRNEAKLQFNEKPCNAVKFQGFQTASRKTIQISEDAQKRAEVIVAAIPDLEDMDLEDDDDNQPSTSKAAALKSTVRPSIRNEAKLQFNEKPCNDSKFQGFQTASRKTIQISEDAQKRAEVIVAAIPDLEDLDFLEDDDDQPSTSKAAALKITAHRPAIRTETRSCNFGVKLKAEQVQRLEQPVVQNEKIVSLVVANQNNAKSVIETATLIAEDFLDIQFSEWPLTEQATKTQEINGEKMVAAETTAAVKRKIHNDDDKIDKPDSKLLCKSHSTSSLPLNRIENTTKLHCSPAKSVIISRRNLLSLSKRKRNRPPSTASSSSTQESADPSPNTVTPIKNKPNNCTNIQTPGTPNLREFFDSLPTNTSTPRPFNDASNSSRTLVNPQKEKKEKVDDFKQNKWQSPNDYLRNHVGVISKSFDTTNGNGVINKSLNVSASKLSPKERIQRLSRYGEPPAISPMTSQNNSCRSLGLRRTNVRRSLTLNKSKK